MTAMKWLIFLSLILTLGFAGTSHAQKPGAGGPPPAPVEVGRVVQKNVQTKITLAGTAEAHRMITLASQVEGLVASGDVEEGQVVQPGQVIVRLEKDKLKLRMAEAKARLREAQAFTKQMERDLKRKQTLHGTKSVPLKDLEDARTSVERQKAVADRMREMLRLLENDLADSQITSPITAVVVKRIAYEGEWVKKGGPVAELAVLDPLKIVVPVPERYLPNLNVGDQAPLTADALPGVEFIGRIQAIIPSGDVRSRSFPVQIRVDNKEGKLKPGMLMRATLGVGEEHEALLVPKDALVISQSGVTVVTIEDGKANPLAVTIVAGHNSLMEVAGPLKPGTVIVIKGNERLWPGQAVQVKENKNQ